MLSIITLTVLSGIIIGTFAALLPIIGMKWCKPLQKLYVRFMDSCSDWEHYSAAMKHIQKGFKIPIIFLSDFSDMAVSKKKEFEKFKKDNPYFLMMFLDSEKVNPVPELCLYKFDTLGNNEIAMSSYYQLLCRDLAYKSGYTESEIWDIMWRGIESAKNREEEYKQVHEELQHRIKNTKGVEA